MKLPTQDQVRYHGERWAWVLGLALLAYLTFPSSAGEAAPLLETGKFADRDLIAPFTFAVSKSDEELAREAEELAATVKPIYEFQPRGLDSARVAVHTFFATVQWLHRTVTVMNDSKRAGKAQVDGALRDDLCIFRIANASPDDGIDIDGELRVLREVFEFLIENFQALH